MTVGVIGGKTRAYLPMAYGMSTFNLGLTFFLDAGDDYGTDPRGFIGWEDQTKTVFFVGILSTTGVIHTLFLWHYKLQYIFCLLQPWIYHDTFFQDNYFKHTRNIKKLFPSALMVVLITRKISSHFTF